MPEWNDELSHYGVLGMKWGIRRYQNADGSLTAAGKKRYSDADKAYNSLKKQIKKERVKQYGWGNQWMWSNTIGEHSKAALDKARAAIRKAEKSEEYKKYEKALKQVEKDFYSGKLNDIEDYDRAYEKVRSDFFKNTEAGKTLSANQGNKINFRTSTSEYANGAGKNITMGYLRDLGYNKEVSERITKMLTKKNLVLGE